MAGAKVIILIHFIRHDLPVAIVLSLNAYFPYSSIGYHNVL